jgi:IMP dehydrogenase
MDTVTGSEMAIAAFESGALGCLHRFMSIEDNVNEFLAVKKKNYECFVSIGVNRDSKERSNALYNAGARYFILDIAHGHSLNAKNMIEWFKKNFSDTHLMVGNVAHPQAVRDLENWGADSIKVGIGPGSACLTKDVTGVTVPQLSAVALCAKVAKVPIVADGGIKTIGDIAKALAAGAKFVMVGGMVSGADECPGEVIDNGGGKFKIYRGMASRDAMRVIRSENQMPTPEGKVTLVPLKGPVKNIIEDIAGGLRSSFSYVNARNLEEFQMKATFGIRRTVR